MIEVAIFAGAVFLIWWFLIRKNDATAKPENEEPIEEDPIEEQPEPPKEEIKVHYIFLSDREGDKTKELQAEFNKIPLGTPDKKVFIKLPFGYFNTEGKTELTQGLNYVTELINKRHWVIDGIGTTFYTKAPAIDLSKGDLNGGYYSPRRHFGLTESEDIEIKGLEIKGSDLIEGVLLGTAPEYTPDFLPENYGDVGSLPGYASYLAGVEFEHGFVVNSCKNITFDNCTVTGVWGDGFYINTKKVWLNGKWNYSPVSENIKILNSTVDFCGRMAVATNEVKNLLIDNLTTRGVRWSSVDLEPDDDKQVIDGVEIKNCDFHNQLVTFPMGGAGDIRNVNIHHNTYSGGGSLYLKTSSATPSIIRKNFKFNYNIRTARGGGDSFKVMWVDNFEAIGNIDRYKGRFLAKLTFCRNVTLKDNTSEEGGGRVHTAWVENLVLSGNTPEAIHTDDSHLTQQWAVDQYEQMKQNNL